MISGCCCRGRGNSFGITARRPWPVHNSRLYQYVGLSAPQSWLAGRSVATAGQTSAAVKAEQLVASDAWQDESVYKIPVITRMPANAIAEAQAAAEAAHRALMTAGPIAEAMRSSNLLASIMEHYSQLQVLYHKAVLPVVERHGMLATSTLDLAYCIYCQLLQRQADKQPGDSVSCAELDVMAAEVKQLPQAKIDHGLVSFAAALHRMPPEWSPEAVDMFVLKDIVAMLSEGPLDMTNIGNIAADTLDTNWLIKGLASAALGGVYKSSQQRVRVDVQNVLVAMCQLSSSPPDTAVPYGAAIQFLGSSLLQWRLHVRLIDAALQLLPSSDQAAILQLAMELWKWLEACHSSPIATTSITKAAGMIPYLLGNLCLFTCYGACMRATAFQQLRGEQPVHDWSAADKAMDTPALLPDKPLRAWLAVQQQLMKLASGGSVQLDEMNAPVEAAAVATAAGHLLAVGAGFVTLELGRSFRVNHSTKVFLAECRTSQLPFLDMLLLGLLQVVDDNHSCWSSVLYWMDIVQLALQQTGGQPGPAAVAAAERLMQEKHSIFLARLSLRLAVMHSPSFASHWAQEGPLMACSPLQIDTVTNSLILARGNRKRAASVAVLQKSGRFDQDQELAHVTTTAMSTEATLGDGVAPTAFEQQLVKLLTVDGQHRPATEDLNSWLAAAGEPGSSQQYGAQLPLDPGLVDAYLAWSNVKSGVGLSQAAVNKLTDKMWFPAALAQWWIYGHCSSPTVGQQLLSSTAVEECDVRPVGQYVQSQARAADGSVRVICNYGWRVSSRTAAVLLCSCLLEHAQPSLDRCYSCVWLAAAALSGEDVSDRVDSRANLGLVAACRAYGTSKLPQSLLLCLILLDAARDMQDQSSHARYAASVWLKSLVITLGPFEQLEQPVQALMQAVVKRHVMNTKQDGFSSFVLSTLESVPLLHAQDYDVLLQMAIHSGDLDAVAGIWQAAISAATDQQLSQTPAFGGIRPDEAWLAQTLQQLMQSTTMQIGKQAAVQQQIHHTDFQGATDICVTCSQLVIPAAEAAFKLLQAGAGSGDVSSQPSGWLLLGTVFAALTAGLLPHQLLDAVTGTALDVLRQRQLAMPPRMVSALCTAVAAGAAVGDMHAYNRVMGYAADVQLTTWDISMIRSAAIQAAANAVVCSVSLSEHMLLQLWSDTLAAAAEEGNGRALLQPAAASKLVAAMVADQTLAKKLLQQQLPVDILSTLLMSAMDTESAPEVQQLVQHAQQHDMLQLLPPQLLAATVRYNAMATGGVAGAADGTANQQVLAVLLQQGQAPDAVAAAGIIRAAAGDEQQWQRLVAWLQQQCSTAPAPTAYAFLCRLLQASSVSASAAESWQVYDLLHQHQHTGGMLVGQQGLPAELCSSLIQQQSISSDRVLQLWHDSRVASAAQLSSQAQRVLLSAVASLGTHDEALQLVQQVPQLLAAPG